MSVSTLGIGSGLDLSNLLDQLVKAERAPVQARLDVREATAQAQLAAFNTIKTAMNELQSASSALRSLKQSRTTEVSDPTVLTATASSTLPAGTSYRMEVSQLASAHSLTSARFTGNQAKDIGSGTLSIKVGKGAAVAIELPTKAEKNTLADLRNAINSKAGLGVTATLINEADGSQYLTLTSRETGEANTINITADGFFSGFTDKFAPAAEGVTFSPEQHARISEGKDAVFNLNGIALQSPSNHLQNIIDGMDIRLLKKTEADSPITINVSQDRDSVREGLNKFIDAYNSVVGQIAELTRFNAESGEAGLMIGDSTLRGLRAKLATDLSAMVAGTPGVAGQVKSLMDLGVRSNPDNGKLFLNSSTLDSALNGDFERVVNVVSEIATRFNNTARDYTRFGGLLDNRTEGLQVNLKRVTEERQRLDARMVTYEARLASQFAVMDGIVGDLKNTSEYLYQQFDSINAMMSQRKR